jgi:hypothetical protein
MRANHHILMVLSVLATMSGIASANDNLVFNGDFSSHADGLVITDTPGGFGYSSVRGNPGGNVFLDNISPSLSSDPTASQVINGLTPGNIYLISGDYLRGKVRGTGLPTGPSFGVAMDGDFLLTSDADPPFSWQPFRVAYVATSSAATLSFSSQINGTGISYNIDNIELHAIPEPSGLALGLIGLTLFATYKVRCGAVCS